MTTNRRSGNEIIKENWLPVLIAVALIVFAIIYFVKSDKSTEQLAPAPPQSFAPSPGFESPVSTPNRATGAIEWCARLDGSEGHHVPHLMGGGEDNGRGGKNWLSGKNANGSEEFGILDDGTYFVKASYLQEAGMTSFVDLKSAEFGWAAKRMVPAEINGQPAYIFKGR